MKKPPTGEPRARDAYSRVHFSQQRDHGRAELCFKLCISTDLRKYQVPSFSLCLSLSLSIVDNIIFKYVYVWRYFFYVYIDRRRSRMWWFPVSIETWLIITLCCTARRIQKNLYYMFSQIWHSAQRWPVSILAVNVGIESLEGVRVQCPALVHLNLSHDVMIRSVTENLTESWSGQEEGVLLLSLSVCSSDDDQVEEYRFSDTLERCLHILLVSE